ncbi:MAG: sigma-70 family RNA polymerase sigma factor [Chloroflexi bacterium]|nr:sigma-70 family RNA polymerase sigma factor [Chloroflexota bacterium]
MDPSLDRVGPGPTGQRVHEAGSAGGSILSEICRNLRSAPHSLPSARGAAEGARAGRDWEDGELATAAAHGDAEAFGRLYDLHADRVFRHVYYRLANRADAEDVTAQVFLKALQAIGRYRPDGAPFFAWLLAIAQNAVIDHLRRSKVTDELDLAVADSGSWCDPVRVADLRCTQGELRRAILGLKSEYRQVIVMRFVDELEHAQIGAVLGKNEGTVRVIQHRALAALRQALGEEARPS